MPLSLSRAPRWCLLLALILLDILFLSPEFPWAGFPPMHWIALEALLVVGLMALMPACRLRRWLCGLVALFAVTIALCALGDGLTQSMQGRSLNLYTDIKLIPILIELVVANLGLPLALVGFIALGLVLFLVASLLAALLKGFHAGNVSRRWALLLIILGGVGIARIDAMRQTDASPWVAKLGHPVVNFIDFEWSRVQDTRRAMADFGNQLYHDDHPWAGPGGAPLPGLANVDVILGFIESYGVAAIEREPFADEIGPRLHQVQQQLSSAGLSVVTGRVTAATLGGQSWLNHATFSSGLPVTSQLRFELMINSQHSTLIDDFKATDHITSAIMPGVVRDWPEGDLYGYDEIHTSDSMGYQGPSMGWASMPDQFTWQRVEDYVLAAHEKSTFTELATLSSHAPWSPVIDMIDDWSTLGDGQVFDRWQGAGDDYASLWHDTQAMRQNYGPAIDYALQAASGFATHYLVEGQPTTGTRDTAPQNHHTLMMILGDHQAAPAVIGDNPGKDVPLHIISDDPALLQGFIDHGFRRGMFPPGPDSAIPMENMRALLHELYGGDAAVDQLGANGERISAGATVPETDSGS